MIALFTDSASQMPASLAAQLGAVVVPVTVTVDGVDHLEGIGLTADAFYARLDAAEELPTISTAQPAASAFVSAFETEINAGATGLLAVLVGSAYSGAVNSAEVAAATVCRRFPDVDIEIVDSGTASFGISCAVWAAGSALAAGASLLGAKQAALDRAAQTGSVFMIDGTELARRSGRFGDVDLGSGIPVLASGPEGLTSLGDVQNIDAGVDLMARELLGRSTRVVVAVGRASAATDPVTDALLARLQGAPSVAELVEYRVGPSIAAHTGPNTVGGFSFPA